MTTQIEINGKVLKVGDKIVVTNRGTYGNTYAYGVVTGIGTENGEPVVDYTDEIRKRDKWCWAEQVMKFQDEDDQAHVVLMTEPITA
jgi:hypothetical protein